VCGKLLIVGSKSEAHGPCSETAGIYDNCATPDFEEGSLVKPGHVKDGTGPSSVPGRHGVGRTVRFDITRPIQS